MADTDAKHRQEGLGETGVPETPEAAEPTAAAPAGEGTPAAEAGTGAPAAQAEAAAAGPAEEAAAAEPGTGEPVEAAPEPADAAGEPEAADPAAAELAALRAELEAARAEVQRNREGWARAQAELENYRKRAQKEKEESIQYEIRRLLQSFLPVLDNLERALAVPEGNDASSLRAGVELTLRQFREALARYGIEAIAVQPGDPFDPAVHEAILQVEGESEEPVVAEVLQGGYRMGDRVIRPALVKVARKGV